MTEISLSLETIVLIVEDEPFTAVSLEMNLRDLGSQQVHIVRTPEIALAFLETRTPILAFVDWQLGDNTSETVVAKLRDLGVGIILMSGYSEIPNLTPWAGYTILAKPFGDHELHAAIASAMNSKGAAQ